MEETKRIASFLIPSDLSRDARRDLGAGSFSIQNEMPQLEDEEGPGVMLEPDHPLLEKFQQLLKKQLERQISKLTEDVSELEVGIKHKSVEREALGDKIFDAQQFLIDVQRTLDKHEIDINQYSTERLEVENDLQYIKGDYKKKRDTLNQVEQKEFEIINDIDMHNFMLQKISEWEERLQAQLHVNQRLTDISKINRKEFSKDKRNLDFFIYKLMTEVFRLEKSIENMNVQFRMKDQEREEVATAIAQINADIESLEFEHKHLINSWKKILVGIGYLDKDTQAILKDLEKAKENLNSTLVEIDSYKKMSAREMKRNEEWTVREYYTGVHLDNMQERLNIVIEKLNNMQEKVDKVQADQEKLYKEKEKYTLDSTLKQLAVNEVKYELELNNAVKVDLEEKILGTLQDQIMHDKIAKSVNNKILARRAKSRNLDIESSNMENEIAQIYIAMEDQTDISDAIPELVQIVREQIKEAQIELLPYKQELKELMFEFKITRADYNAAHAEHHRLFYMSWRILKRNPKKRRRELRNVVRREIRKIRKDSKMEKYYWVRKQRYIVVKRIQRKRQVTDMIVTERQNSLLELKVPKILYEMEDVQKIGKVQYEKTRDLKIKLDEMKELLKIKKGVKYTFSMDHSVFRTVCNSKLKDAEMECIKLEAELMQLDEEKDALCKELIERNRDHLAWKHKCNSAIGIKQILAKENAADGEIGTMRAEIHRMNIRYSQLRRAQEKLVQDLNICLSRREYIFSTAEATEKRSSLGGKVNSHIHFKRKLEELRSKVKKTENERKSVEKQISDAYKSENDTYETIAALETATEDTEKDLTDWVVKSSNQKMSRRLEGDFCLAKQHKIRDYTYIFKGQYYNVFRARLDTEFSLQYDTNFKLQTIIENLLLDFPNHNSCFRILLNFLKAVINDGPHY